MTILYFADTRFPIERANGLQTMATCHALAARGHEVTLITRADSAQPARDPFDYYGFPRLASLTIDRLESPAGVRARRAHFLLTSALRLFGARADVAYTRDLGLAAFLLRLPAARRPPVIYESHGLSTIVSAELPVLLGKPELQPSRPKLQRLNRRERRVWSRADAYVTITKALADELTARYGARDRVFVVPDAAVFEPQNPGTPEPGVPVAGYAGHLYPWKGVDLFLQALARAPHIRGLIVGGHPAEDDLARVRKLIGDLGLTPRVDVTGLVRPGEVRDRLAAATMLVLPNTPSAISERYTSPLKLFEYLTMGQPIIASDLPSIREILTPGETALLVPAGDPERLAEAMTQLAGDHALSARLARAGLALAADYTWEARARRLEPALTSAARR